MKLCECGCGGAAPVAPYSLAKKGWKAGEPLRFIHGHNRRKPDDAGIVGYCQCRCGSQTTIAERTVKRRGWRKGYPKPYLPGHSSRRGPVDYVVDENGCWVWQRRISRTGYGMVSSRPGASSALAHRVYYEERYGPVPPKINLDHLCRNRACVNPDHLEPVTLRINIRRGANTILTQEQVDEIRAYRPGVPRYGRRDLAARYGVSEATIKDVRNDRTWLDGSIAT